MPRITVKFSNTFGQEPMVEVPVNSETTVGAFLETQGGVPENAVVKVNRQAADLDAQLTEGDIVSLVPSQIKGA